MLCSTWNVKTVEKARADFENRYIHNIYGPSLLTVIYQEGNPAGSGAMWRNDINGRKAYQRIDTCTLEPYRGCGLFRKAITKELSLIEEDALSYGFANPSSLAGYLKFGWNVLKMEKLRLLISLKKYTIHNPSVIDYEYAKWYLTKFHHRLYRVYTKGVFFLVLPTRHKRIYQIVGRAEKEAAMLFEQIKGPKLLIYSTIPAVVDSSNQGNVVVTRYKTDIIPWWKCDAI